MKYLFDIKIYSLLAAGLLTGVSIVAEDVHNMQEQLECVESRSGVQADCYICLDKEISDIARVLIELSSYDDNVDSPLHLLKRHLDNEHVLAFRDEMLIVMDYADWFIQEHRQQMEENGLAKQFEAVAQSVLSGQLSLTEEDVMRSPHLRLLTVNERMRVLGKAIFKNIVVMDKKLRTHGDAHFYKDVTVDGTISVQDEVINCDLTVGCDINLNDSTSDSIGNVTKAGERFIHNYGTENTFVGKSSGNFALTGVDNVGCGDHTLEYVLTGFNNTAVGAFGLQLNATGTDNVACGSFALNQNTQGAYNVAVGSRSLFFNNANNNTAAGMSALQYNTVGSGNNAFGAFCLQNNTTGYNNVGIGSLSLRNNTTGILNIAIGTAALQNNTVGWSNIVIGGFAGSNAGFVDGEQNVIIGTNAGSGLAGSGNNNNIYIGTNAGISGSEANTIRLGGTGLINRAFIGGVYGTAVGITNLPVIVDNAGQIGTLVSSAQFKRNIENITEESNRIYALNPVSFVYKNDVTDTQHYGLIAEEVAQVFPELVVNDQDGNPLTVHYEVLPVLLINELKKLQTKIALLEDLHEIKALIAKIVALEKIVETLQGQVAELLQQ